MNIHKAFQIISTDIPIARDFTTLFKNFITVTGTSPGEILTFNYIDTFDRVGEISFVSNLRGLRKFYWCPRTKNHVMNAVVIGVKTRPLVAKRPGGARIHIEVDHRLIIRPDL